MRESLPGWAAALALAVLASAPWGAEAHIPPASDVQWWQELDFTGELHGNFSYLVVGFSRFSDNEPNPALTGVGGFLTWTHGSLAYSLGYLHAQLRLPSTGGRLNADLPIAALTGSVEMGLLTLRDRLRGEDLIGVPGNPWRYRNLVSAGYTVRGLGPLKSVAVSDEIFVDANSRRLTRNRFLAGPIFSLGPRVDVAFDYVNQRDRGARPGRIQGGFLDVSVHL